MEGLRISAEQYRHPVLYKPCAEGHTLRAERIVAACEENGVGKFLQHFIRCIKRRQLIILFMSVVEQADCLRHGLIHGLERTFCIRIRQVGAGAGVSEHDRFELHLPVGILDVGNSADECEHGAGREAAHPAALRINAVFERMRFDIIQQNLCFLPRIRIGVVRGQAIVQIKHRYSETVSKLLAVGAHGERIAFNKASPMCIDIKWGSSLSFLLIHCSFTGFFRKVDQHFYRQMPRPWNFQRLTDRRPAVVFFLHLSLAAAQ